MKKLVFLMVAFMVFFLVFSAFAANKPKAATFSVTGGGYFFENNQNYEDDFTVGVRAGYNFTENWGAELFFHYVPSEYKPGGGDNDFYFAGIEALYHFMPRNRFVPFLALGAGATHYSSDKSGLVPSKFAVDYGAGFKFFIIDNLAFRADVRHVMPLGDTQAYGNNQGFIHNDLMVTGGLLYSFGGDDRYAEKLLKELEEEKVRKVQEQAVAAPPVEKPVVAPPPAPPQTPVDLDRDGVPDVSDECPNTPASVVVDNKGCPPDSDKDGVPDYLDQCPNTPAGMRVDEKGCCGDDDHDGVANDVDKCPNTPQGAVVAKDGCVYETISTRLRIEFDSGKAVIKKQYHEEIKKVADFMKEHPEATATIVGHTDNIGSEKRNQELSLARAESVRQYLIKNFGIDGSRIRVFGYGSERPIASNDTKEGRQRNRRIVAVFEGVVAK